MVCVCKNSFSHCFHTQRHYNRNRMRLTFVGKLFLKPELDSLSYCSNEQWYIVKGLSFSMTCEDRYKIVSSVAIWNNFISLLCSSNVSNDKVSITRHSALSVQQLFLHCFKGYYKVLCLNNFISAQRLQYKSDPNVR